MADAPFLDIQALTKTYPGASAPAVDGVDLQVAEGQLLALLGPSGCGKTTTLRMIAGLVQPSSGRISVDGRDLTRVPVHRRGMGMVFQSFALFPHMNVTENVAFGLQMRRVSSAERRRLVSAVLKRVELGHLASRRVGQLSGGQQQRVALARALVIDPTLLLLDEPLSALDAKLRESLRVQIREIQQSSGTTSVFVTHDQGEALSMADQVAVMKDGVVEQLDTPSVIYTKPKNVFVATFIGRANLLEGELDGDGVLTVPGLGPLHVQETGTARRTGAVTAMIRPQFLRVRRTDDGTDEGSPQRPVHTGVVRSISYTGDQISYRVDTGGHTLAIEAGSDSAPVLEQGEQVQVSWSAADLRLLERE